MKIFIICTVRGAAQEYRDKLEQHVKSLEAGGHQVHLPHRDTDQTASGFEICSENMAAIENSDIVEVFYNPASQGTHFDLGVAFALGKPLRVMETVEPIIIGKSFSQAMQQWMEHDQVKLDMEIKVLEKQLVLVKRKKGMGSR